MHLWVREGDGKFSLYGTANKHAGFTVPMAADGSVGTVETRDIGVVSQPRSYRITVPPGNGPRAFDLLDLVQACQYRMVPL